MKLDRMVLSSAVLAMLALIILAVVLAGCGSLPFSPQTRPTALPTPVPSPVPTETPGPTNTPVMPPTPIIPTDTPVPTIAPLPNLSAVKLTAKDLPAGFQDVSADNLKKMNLTEDALAVSLRGMVAQSRPQNFAALMHPQKNEIVVDFLLFPITPAEKAALGAQLANSDSTLKSFGVALLGASGLPNAKPLAGVDKFGDKSIGFSTTITNAGVVVRADSVMISRGAVVQVLMAFHPDSTPPAIATADLAKLLDTRLATTLAGK